MSKKTISYLKKIALTAPRVWTFLRKWGFKNAYFEDVFKMAKKLLKMPKTVPK